MSLGCYWEIPLFQVEWKYFYDSDSPAHMVEIRISVQLKTVFANSVQELVHPRGWSSFASYCSIHTGDISGSIGSHVIIIVLEKLVNPIREDQF